jgi:hypothetical protein
MLDLYTEELAAVRSRLRPTQDVEPGVFANFLPGTGSVFMRLAAEAARSGSMALSLVPRAIDELTAFTMGTPAPFKRLEATERYFKFHDEVFGSAVDYWTPKPNEVGVAAEVAGSLLAMLPMVVASPALAVASQQLSAAENLVRRHPDVTAWQAQAVGAAQAIGLGFGIWAPILGNSLATRVLVGGAGANLAQGVATRAVSGAVLQGTEAAKEFEAFDPKYVTLDVLLGLAFGAYAHISPAQRAQGAAAWAQLDQLMGRAKPSEVDALAVLRTAQHLNEDSLPGKPVTDDAVRTHVEKLRSAIDSLARDHPVDVERTDVPRETSVRDQQNQVYGLRTGPDRRVEPRFTPDPAKEAAAREVADAMTAEAPRIQVEEGLTQLRTPAPRPPSDITALEPEAQARAIGQQIERKLVDTGMQTKEAVANAAIWESFARSAHARYGVTPAEIMARWGVDVRKMAYADMMPGALEQSQTQPFYSELSRQVDTLKLNAAPAKGWLNAIKGLVNKGVVKQAEIDATGLREWIELQQGRVTKQQVQDYLAQNGVRVETITLGAETKSRFDVLEERIAQGRRLTEDELSEYDYLGRYDAAPHIQPTKHSQWQLPGGTNYRELLLMLPSNSLGELPNGWRVEQYDASLGREWRVLDASGAVKAGGLTTRQKAIDAALALSPAQAARDRGDFRSVHFDQPNILAHVRFNERVDADGKRVLFLEEIQSDWAQKGKREGFDDQIAPLTAAEKTELRTVLDYPGIDIRTLTAEQIARRNELVARSNRGFDKQASVPRGPFVEKTEAWVALAMKRMIRYAAENGFDRVAWTNGEQQAARYDLSKQVDKITVVPRTDAATGERTRSVSIQLKDSMVVSLGVDAKGVVDNSSLRQGFGDVVGKPLADVIGKDMADKIMQTERGTFEGEGLKVGGEGMKAFYDRIVPNVANDVLKKLGGGKVALVRFPEVAKADVRGDPNAPRGWDVAETSTAANSGMVKEQSGFDITPALREKAMAGMPLFQPGARGAVNFETGRSIISLFEKADKSTFQHETAHVFLEMTKDLATRPDAPLAAAQDWATIAKWLKIEGGQITRAQHEQWARGWEKYLAEGVAPNEALKGAFKQFRDWLLDIYRSLAGIDSPINNEIRGVMARLLDSQAKDPQERVASTDQGRGSDARGPQELAAPRQVAGGARPPPDGAGREAGGDAGTDALRNEALRVAEEHSELRVRTGTAPDGTPMYASIRELLEEAALQRQLAEQDANLFRIAAECYLG